MDNFDRLSEIIKRRRSIRTFNSRPVDIDLVRQIIDLSSHAPSNHNRQGWKFYVVQDQKIIQKIGSRVTKKLDGIHRKSNVIDDHMKPYQKNFTHFENAPVFIACCFVKPNRFQSKVFDVDEENRHFTGELISLSLVMQNILLASESVGIGTLIMTAPLIAACDIKQILNIPNKYTIGAFICMGYYDERPEAPPHRPLDQILHMV